jgi:D-3-phosphoglycerate dehydrogenase
VELDGGYVLLPQPIEDEAYRLLKERKLAVMQAENPKRETVAPLMKNARAIVLRTGITMDEELLLHADNLITISRTGGGVDNIDLDAATKRGIIVTSSLGVNTGSVVEHCCALILSLFKQLFFLDRETKAGNFRVRYRNEPADLMGKTAGVIGFGRIGSGLAKILHDAFGMEVLAYDEYLPDNRKEKYSSMVSFAPLDFLFSRADVVSIHLPLTEETRGLVEKRYLSMMKPTAFIINSSRGGVIVENDLVQALEQGTIKGAGLDVFEQEPPAEDSPILRCRNVICTPHSAALTTECVVRMATSAVHRIIDVLEGYIPENIANPQVVRDSRWKSLKRKPDSEQ